MPARGDAQPAEPRPDITRIDDEGLRSAVTRRTGEEWAHVKLRALRTAAALCEEAAGAGTPAEKALRVALRAAGEIEASHGSADLERTLRRAVADLSSGSAAASPSARLAERAAEYIRTHQRRPIGLSEVAAHVGLSPWHLSRLFKRERGVGFARYLLQLRMAEARRLLTTTDLSAADVAFAVGFDDAQYFSRVFSRAHGMPPGEFRRRAGVESEVGSP